jgi:L-asparaginase
MSLKAMVPRPRITFIQTGGTIDKDYPRSTMGYAFEIADAATERIIADVSHVPLGIDVDFQTACRKDSTELTREDRETIANLCNNVPSDKIVITHGTDTMIETANFLSADTRLSGKTVVLTGSMRPQRFRESDAPFNVGIAVGAVQVLPPGCYVAMGGAVFPHEQCRRDLESGAFLALSRFKVNDKVFVEEPIESEFEDAQDLINGSCVCVCVCVCVYGVCV